MGPKPAPWQNRKKRDEAIVNSGLPYGMPLYHVRVPDYRATDEVLDKLDRDMRTIGESKIIREEIIRAHPLYHIRIWPLIKEYGLPDVVRDEIEQHRKDVIARGGMIITDTKAEIKWIDIPPQQEFLRLLIRPTEVGNVSTLEEMLVNPRFTIWERPPAAVRDGFHVSVLDPYPEGA